MKRASACHSVGRHGGRQRQLDHDRTHGVGRHFLAGLVDDANVVAGHRHCRRAVFDRQQSEADRVADDRPTGFGLPPVIDHRHFQHRLRPFERGGIGAFAGEKQRAEFRQIVLREQLALRVFLLDGAECGRRGEQRDGAVLGDHAPERAGVRRADRLAFVEDRGRAVQQRRVDDVAVADHPADIGRRPPHLSGIDTVEIFHRPFERDHVAAIVAHHALRPPGRAGRVKNVERVGRHDRHAIPDRAGVDQRVVAHRRPVAVAAVDQRGFELRALQDQTSVGLCAASVIASSSSGL